MLTIEDLFEKYNIKDKRMLVEVNLKPYYDLEDFKDFELYWNTKDSIAMFESQNLTEDFGNLKKIDPALLKTVRSTIYKKEGGSIYGGGSLITKKLSNNSEINTVKNIHSEKIVLGFMEDPTVNAIILCINDEQIGMYLRNDSTKFSDTKWVYKDKGYGSYEKYIKGMDYKHELSKAKESDRAAKWPGKFLRLFIKHTVTNMNDFNIMLVRADQSAETKRKDRMVAKRNQVPSDGDILSGKKNQPGVRGHNFISQAKADLAARLENFKMSKAVTVKDFDSAMHEMEKAFLEKIKINGIEYKLTHSDLSIDAFKASIKDSNWYYPANLQYSVVHGSKDQWEKLQETGMPSRFKVLLKMVNGNKIVPYEIVKD